MIGDVEAAVMDWLVNHVSPDGGSTQLPVVGKIDPDDACVVPFRAGGDTDSGTFLDHPLIVVDVFGDAPPGETSKAAVAKAACEALTRVFAMKGQTIGDVYVTDVAGRGGLQLLPEQSGRWHYQFTVAVTCHKKQGV